MKQRIPIWTTDVENRISATPSFDIKIFIYELSSGRNERVDKKTWIFHPPVHIYINIKLCIHEKNPLLLIRWNLMWKVGQSEIEDENIDNVG